MRIEIVRSDRWGRITQETGEQITFLELDCDVSGVYKTRRGEEINVDTENYRLDLTKMRSLRDAVTGRKGDRRFIRDLRTRAQQLDPEWLLLVR